MKGIVRRLQKLERRGAEVTWNWMDAFSPIHEAVIRKMTTEDLLLLEPALELLDQGKRRER